MAESFCKSNRGNTCSHMAALQQGKRFRTRSFSMFQNDQWGYSVRLLRLRALGVFMWPPQNVEGPLLHVMHATQPRMSTIKIFRHPLYTRVFRRASLRSTVQMDGHKRAPGESPACDYDVDAHTWHELPWVTWSQLLKLRKMKLQYGTGLYEPGTFQSTGW